MHEKIKITPIDLENQKPGEIQDCFLEFFNTHLNYKLEFYAAEPIDLEDSALGWDNNVYNHYDIIALKSKISGVEKSFTKNKSWGVFIIVTGFAQDIKIYFKSQTKANDLYDKIVKWLIE